MSENPNAPRYNIGDLVQLKSGGPIMTVKRVVGYSTAVYGKEKESYVCQWFAGKKLEDGEFPLASLVAVPGANSEKQQ